MPRAAERRFATQLRRVSRQVGKIVQAHASGARIVDQAALDRALQEYATLLEPWAGAVVETMLNSVGAANLTAWRRSSRALGRELREQLLSTPIGDLLRQLHHDQVTLITSLPTEAGLRAQEYAQEAMLDSTRAEVVAKKIQDLGNLTASRAELIARTEIAKTNSILTQVRAQSAGIEEYYWRTMEDEAVRPAHAEMEGRRLRFDTPPEVRGEGRHGPGQIYNCRCFAEPIL